MTVHDFEIARANIFIYSRLVWHDNEICRVAYRGEVVLNIDDVYKAKDYELCVSDPDSYRNGRKRYIETRCKKGIIVKTVIHSVYDNSQFTLLGNFRIWNCDDGFCIGYLTYLDGDMGGCGEHYIDLPEITKSSAGLITLNFENCENVAVYHNEIVDIRLEYSQELYTEGWGGFYRQVTGGYIRVAFSYSANRDGALFGEEGGNAIDDISAIEKRLCGKSGESIHDICNLYISHGRYKEERLVVDTVEFIPLELCNCGICKKLNDGSILIAFGKSAGQTVQSFI